MRSVSMRLAVPIPAGCVVSDPVELLLRDHPKLNGHRGVREVQHLPTGPSRCMDVRRASGSGITMIRVPTGTRS